MCIKKIVCHPRAGGDPVPRQTVPNIVRLPDLFLLITYLQLCRISIGLDSRLRGNDRGACGNDSVGCGEE